jgi:histidinol-phosphate aminotransferase
MNRVRQPFNANTLALAAGIEAINDEDHITKSVKINKQGLERVKIAFEKHDFDFIESYGNFISFDSQKDSDLSFDFFLKKGIILRSLKVYEMPTHLRVSIGLEEEIDIFLSVLEEYKRSLNA